MSVGIIAEAADRVQKNAVRTQLLPPEFEKNPVAALRSIVTPYEQMMQLLRRL